MREPLSCTITETPKGTFSVKLRGRICEYSAGVLTELLRDLGQPDKLIIDLAEVSGVNSVGLREWLTFIRAVSPRAHRIELHGCPVPFVAQLNIVAGLAGAGVVRSIYLPFLCEHCGADRKTLVDVVEGERPAFSLPNCERCGAIMIFDDLEEAYFAFLSPE